MSPTIDPSKLKVTELREELQARGLDTKGNKPVLVKRLKKALDDESKGLPPSSKGSSEDLDSTRTDEASGKDGETEAEPEQESESLNETEANSSSQENAEEPEDSDNVEATDAKTNGEEDASKAESNENNQTNQVSEEKTEAENEDVEMKEETVKPSEKHKGEKRKRTEESASPPKKKVFKITEDEPEIDADKVLLSWYDSDLHLVVDKQSFLSAKPLCEGLFGYAWAGVRTTHGVSSGKVYYEVKLTDEMAWVDYVNQRREKREHDRAKDRRGRRQNKDSKKNEKKDKVSKSQPEKKKEEPQEEKMEVTENEEIAAENSADANTEKETSAEETKTDAESSAPTEGEVEKPAEAKEEETKEELAEEETKEELVKEETKEELAEEENKESSDNKEKSAEVASEEKKVSEEPKKEVPVLTHIFRVGWSCLTSNLQLGEDDFSYGYESTGKFVSNKEFKDFAVSYKKGDVVGAYLDISTDKVEMRFTVNGELQPEVISIPRSELPEEDFAFFPHILSRNFGFELNVGNKEEPWFSSPEALEDYSFIQDVDEKVQGPVRPEKRADCEVILMCGLPGSGKSHWVSEYLKTNEDKPINVIGASHLLNKMTVHGQPLKSAYKGPWNILMEKLQRCLNRLGDLAAQRRRNYILDQTHVFPTVQQRKLRAFEGFKRRAVVIVVGDEEYAKRQAQKEAAVGKEIQDHTYMEMKATMTLPTQGEFCDEIIYTDLNEEEAKAKVTQYNKEGKAFVDKKRKNRGDHKGRFSRGYNNSQTQRRSNYRDNWAPQRYDRGPRGWGQLPPPGRNPRDRRSLPAMPAGRPGWMRNERGPPRSGHDRSPRDGRQMNYNRNQGGGRQNNWQGGNEYGQGRWGGQQGNWGYGNQGWGSDYQGGGNWNGHDQWKYNQGYDQQGYGPNYDYYGQYSQNWSGQYS